MVQEQINIINDDFLYMRNFSVINTNYREINAYKSIRNCTMLTNIIKKIVDQLYINADMKGRNWNT